MAKKRKWTPPVRTRKQAEYLLGYHPRSGVLHSLALFPNGSITIEREPYVFSGMSRYDGSLIVTRQEFETVEGRQVDHAYLIDLIRANNTPTHTALLKRLERLRLRYFIHKKRAAYKAAEREKREKVAREKAQRAAKNSTQLTLL